MFQVSKLAVVLMVALLAISAGCTRVEPGYVGIKVNSYGSQKGVEDFPLQTGRVWLNPFTEEVYTFPTYMQNQSWAATSEGNDADESITFNSAEGSSITVDIGLNYTINAEMVPHIFVKHRQSVDVITDAYLRNKVRDAFGRVGGNFKAVQIFGEKKQELLDIVKSNLVEQLEPEGFMIDTISFISAPKADARVMESINMVIEATQRAIEAENKVRQVEAEAEQATAKARGMASAILAEAEAQAKANSLITESLTPDLIRYKMLEQWDGVAPKVISGDSGGMLFSIDAK